MNKSLFKRPGTKHFQLVHRSQRDPLINDPEASDRVLKEVGSAQAKGKYAGQTNLAPDAEQLGDASSYGIYYDDATYNYMQHLKPVGTEVNAYLVEAPLSGNAKGKGKSRAERDGGITIRDLDLPEDALPSHPLDEVTYDEITKSAGTTLGLRPDMSAGIRQVLEALDDEAYAVDDGAGTDGEDEFWGEVVQGGEVEEGDEWEEDVEEGDLEIEEGEDQVGEMVQGDWDQVKKFKAMKLANPANSDDEEEESEGGDTIAELRAASARRPKRKLAANSVGGSQFSMTSSAMFRNEGLRTLDERFDQIEKLYEEDSESSWGSHSSDGDSDGEGPPSLAPAREDLDAIMDEFLSRYEVLGGKLRPVLAGTTGAGKLDVIRREIAKLDISDSVQEGESEEAAMRRREKEKILEAVDRQEVEESKRGKGRVRLDWENKKERWDCETILSTYSNVSNHPRLLRIRESSGPRPARITIDRKTGFPVVELTEAQIEAARIAKEEEMDEDSDDEDEVHVETIIRPRNETPEERKARKDNIKLERSSRRAVKKGTKEAFGNEMKRQKKAATKKVAGGGAADIRVGDGVRKLA